MSIEPRTPIEGVRRIAVLRATVLGDLVFALPALEALRAAYPAAEIVLLARAWHRVLLSARPSPVDRVVALPEGIVGDEGVAPLPDDERARVLASLAEDHYDLALQLHGGGRNSNRVVLALGARVTAGTRTPDAPPLDRWIPYVYWQSEVMRALEVVGLVGAGPVVVEPALAVTADDRASSTRVVPDDGRPISVLHPGASDPRRRWPADRFAAVARHLAGRGMRVLVTGTEPERPIVAEVVADAPGSLDLAGRLDLTALVGTLARSALLVSNDTGPLHLGGAIGAATVGIYWAGNLVNGGPPFRARHRPILAWRTACPTCGRDCIRDACGHDASFVADIPVAEVVDAVDALLDA